MSVHTDNPGGPSASQPLPGRGMSAYALWRLGFRPFFLLAAVFSALSVPLWAAQLSGWLNASYLQGPVWHGHEMLFGYTMAVIAGFLLTAVRNWTGQPTPGGVPLMAVATLWLCGRILVMTPLAMTAAVVNAAFPLAVALCIGIPLARARNVRNYFFAALLVLLSAAVFIVHLAWQGRIELAPRFGLQLALDLVLFIMAVMGGRVIPMFTNNGVPEANATRNAVVEKLSLGVVIALFAADLLQSGSSVIVMLAATGAVAHAIRWWLWKPWRTVTTPLVWILHAGYIWIAVHLALRALAELGWIAGSFAVHALTAGAIGGLTIGMMTRVARGHTARPLVAGASELAMFLLVQLAGIVRVFVALVPLWYMTSMQLSALLWAMGFGLYAVTYWPVLTRPRLDGKPG